MLKLRYTTNAPAPAFIRAIAPLAALLAVLAPIAATTEAFAAVPVQINSGDPAFPFPQFLPYEHPNGDVLYNLGTHNPAGVVHAEMEKSIRDAYQIMMNRAFYPTPNITLNGIKYIKFNSDCDCSEGTGYALLAAAMMADKTTFDGLWLYAHDFFMNRVVRYRDGSDSPPYNYSVLPGVWNQASDNSATDGDVDYALALMIAYKQWGEFMGINDSRGNKISYKADFIKVIKGLTDTLRYAPSAPERTLVSGDIGLDGYLKNGDSWHELTGWSQNMLNLATIGVNTRVETAGPEFLYFDYSAPAYFRQFADYMEAENAAAYAWNISQFRRAEASCDWLMGKLYSQNPKNIPMVGQVRLDKDTIPVFVNYNEGEDFRSGWRTVLNYMWHGNPRYTWDPVNHAIINRANTFQRDMGQRYAKFLWDRRPTWNGNKCETIIGAGSWWGPSMLKQFYTPQGDEEGTWTLNWIHGTGSPSAVTAQDADLMAEMYRQAELEWGVEEPGDRYLTSVPTYFHGFFRLLGMNVLTGNHHAPMNMKKSANMKVYLDVDKTYAFEDDTITYTIDYRNYGADEAKGVQIVDRMPADFVFVSGTNSPTVSGNTVTWNIGNVPGFKTSTGINPTKGTVTLKVRIPTAKLKRYENKVTISCTNGSGWTSNEYPNKISSVMKRTGVDIASRALRVEHSISRDTVNPGMTTVYTIDIENSAKAGWLNGGRPGVNFSYAHDGTAASAGSHTFQIRAFNDAHEAYIDYGNYRISYFLFDNNYKGLGPNGWNVRTDILYVPEAEQSKFKLLHENITPGEDAKGKWNQRLILQIADVLDPSRSDTNWGTMAAPTQFLINYSGLDQRVHRGISTPFKGVWAAYAGNYANRNWGGDWSYNSKAKSNIATDAMADWGYPITPDFTDNPSPDNPGKPVTLVHRKLCGVSPASTTIDNILIEEWDGYTWRRVFGNGPLPGREVVNVVIRDTLPPGVTFLNFIEPYPLGIAPKITGRVITWEIDKLLIGEKGSIKYTVRADTVPPAGKNVVLPSNTWAAADKESPMKAPVTLVVTLDSLPPPPPEPTTMYKRADKKTYSPGDTVVYTIAYKQTHGYPAVSNSPSQWVGTGTSAVSSDGKTISFGNSNVDMSFTPASGTNVTLTGTMSPQSYGPSFYIFARRTAQGSVELKFERKYIQSENFAGVMVTITSNGRTIDSVGVPMAGEEASINYKFVFKNDSLLMWMGDTSAPIAFRVTKGIAVQNGDAGVRYASDNGSSSITGWASRSDLAYDVTIYDTIPFGVRPIGSPTGSINTGTLAPKQLTGSVSGNVISWPVVSGADNPLGANDSLTLTWRGIVDTSKTGSVVNTAYTDLKGYPKDVVGAQVRSRFSLVKGPDEPDDPDPPDPPKGELTLEITPPGHPNAFMFSGSVTVTLSSQRSDAVIWYTTNGQIPDSTSLTTRRYTGPIEFITSTTLRAAAYAEGCEPVISEIHRYEPLTAVPIMLAIFYDNVGDGLAHGVKVVISPGWRALLDTLVVGAHPELLSLIGREKLPELGAMRFAGDTIDIPFKNGAKLDPQGVGVKLKVSNPPLQDQNYKAVDGYLEGCELNIIDGVVAIITKAVYYMGTNILSVTFNKLPGVYSDADTAVRLTPFRLWYSGGTYDYYFECKTSPQQEGGTTYNFVVTGIKGKNPPLSGVPSDGDSIRVMVGEDVRGIWQKDPSIVQLIEKNKAVALKVKYPDIKYNVRPGPNPSRDSVRIFVSAVFEDAAAQKIANAGQYMQTVLEGSAFKAMILDRMGSVVTVIELKAGNNKGMVNERRVLVWDGCNYKGRKVGTGTYQIVVIITDQDGNKRTEKSKVFINRGKRR